MPILEQLDPRISVVISGHTHQTYVCDYAIVNPQRPFLLTSAGLYSTQLTDIQLRWDPKTLTGAQIKALLEDTYAEPLSSSGRKRVLSPNADLSWRHAPFAPVGQQVQDIRLRGQPLDMHAPYRVVVSSFLAHSGDRYTVFSQGTERTQGPLDIDALEAYIRAHSPLPAPATNRIR